MAQGTYTIGIIAPSLPSVGKREQKVRAALSHLENKGHTVLVSESTFAVQGYKSCSARQRAAELSAFLRDPRVEIIFATTGGYNSNEILECMDLTSFTPSKKLFVGYSDCTALSMALELHGVCHSVSGPMLVDFVDWPECFDEFFLSLESPSKQLTNELEAWESLEAGRFSIASMQRLPNKTTCGTGGALAANLSTLCLMVGTPHLPSFDKRVLFLEYDREEQMALPSLERFLWQLRQAGLLEHLSGLVFGALQPSVLAEQTSVDSIERILTEVTAGYTYPVVYNAQFGHFYPSWIIFNGRRVSIDKESLCIAIAV